MEGFLYINNLRMGVKRVTAEAKVFPLWAVPSD